MPHLQPKTRPRPVIRVFISSTFSDLKHERNALQEHVFPKLEQLCQRNSFQFQAIDLRWGISSEAGFDHRTMRICFDELRRAQEISPRPNFLILLGNRYGWRPLPEAIFIAEFQALERAAATLAAAMDRPALAVLREWYRRDDNADPPLYLLQSRRQHLPDGKDYTKDEPWYKVQSILWAIINYVWSPERFSERFDEQMAPDDSPPPIVRFQASATEQEIWHGALRVPDAQEHVLAFFREIENIDDFTNPTQIKNFVDIASSGGIDAALQAEQKRLKEELRKRLGEANVFETRSARLIQAKDDQTRSFVDITTDHLTSLCRAVETRLTRLIQGQIDQYWHKTDQATAERAQIELRIELEEHQRFSRERGAEDVFVGRKDELQAILDYLQSDSTWPLVVHGASGCGKTALLSRASQELGKTRPPIVRFIGVMPRSSDIRSLLSSLCQELRQLFPRKGEIPTDTKALKEELLEHFRSATPEQPLILFLDALDQLSDTDNGRLLHWLPAGPLPDQVKLVVSCLSDRAENDLAGRPYTELRRRQIPEGSFLNLDVLTEVEAGLLLFHRWLPQAGRTVNPEQRARIGQRLKSAACRQPIYLKLLFEEVRLWHSYEQINDLGEDVTALLGQLFARLGQPANHGPLLVERVLGYLAASRYGLAENEILEILFADPDYKTELYLASETTRHALPPSATRIPVAIWSRLRFDLASYLTERTAAGANVLTFYHRQVAEWALEHFGNASKHRWQPQHRLADYFIGCAQGPDLNKPWETLAVRGFSECVFHLVQSGQNERAAELLGNFPFLMQKTRVGLLKGVFEDYEILSQNARVEVMKRLEIWSDFFREKAYILRRGNAEWPSYKILFQLAVEHADDSPLTIGAEAWLAQGRCDWLWLRRIQRLPHAQKTPCEAVLEGHTHAVYGALELSDNRLLSWSGDSTLRIWDGHSGACLSVLEGHANSINGALELDDGRLLSWSSDRTLRIWDGYNGACLAVLKGHRHFVSNALELKNGRLLSWSSDCTLRIWDGRSGTCLTVLEGHDKRVMGALELGDVRLLSWSYDDTLRIWDTQNGSCLAVLGEHTDWIKGAIELADRCLLSWSKDGTLRLWDAQNGACLAVLKGHNKGVVGALELGDGRLLSWSEDETLRLWNAQKGLCLAVLEGHNKGVVGALELADGRLLSWSEDGTLRLWDAQNGACLTVLEGHNKGVIRALELVDRRLLSYSYDGAIRLWNAQSGARLAVFEGHTDSITGALELADGRLLSWSWDKTLRIWDSRNDARLTVIDGHANKILGVLKLADGRMLSWSEDGTLRLWNAQNGACLTVLRGHNKGVLGALELGDGRLLSWSADGTLRLWDAQNGLCLAVFEGHTERVEGVRELAGGRLLSWSYDKTLRLWDCQSRICLAVLKGHTDGIKNVLMLADGRLLSWARSYHTDDTMRIWDVDSGACLAVLKGHTHLVEGAKELADGRLLSWSADETLRIWDAQSGTCLAIQKVETFGGGIKGVLELADGRLLLWYVIHLLLLQWDTQNNAWGDVLVEGHSDEINGALELADGRLLSWSTSEMCLWDGLNGDCSKKVPLNQVAKCNIVEWRHTCLEKVPIDQVPKRHPEWLQMRAKEQRIGGVFQDFFIEDYARSVSFFNHNYQLAAWHADTDVRAPCLLEDGTAVVTQENGQVCILKLYRGHRRMSLAEAEEIMKT